MAPAEPVNVSRPGTAGMAGAWNLPLATTTRSKRSSAAAVAHQPSGAVPRDEVDAGAESDARGQAECLGVAVQVAEDVAV